MFVRDLTAAERHALRRGLKSADAFTVRRSQVLLASADRAGPAARSGGPSGVRPGRPQRHPGVPRRRARVPDRPSRRAPRRPGRRLGPRRATTTCKDLLHRRPREFGKPTSLWTLALVAEVCHEKGWTTRRLTAEAIRQVLEAAGRRVEAGQALDHQPGPRLRQEKKLRDRLIARGGRRPGLGAGVPGRVLVDPAGPARPVRLDRRRPAAAGGRTPGTRRAAGRRRWPATGCCGPTPAG